jgi:Rieske Fe-S protein
MTRPDRRSFLHWAVHGLSAVFAAVLGVPALAYLIDGRNRSSGVGQFKRVARLGELVVDKPRVFTVRETRRDAWTLHPNEVVGRVFLVRRPGDRVDAYTTICPHLGCSINYTGGDAQPFLCPCHGGCWNIHGHRIDPGNVAPRDMDALDVETEPVPDSPGDRFIAVKYLNFVQGSHEKIVRS